MDLFFKGCGAESEPKKNQGLPEMAALTRASLSLGSLATGLQKLIGLPAQSSTIRCRWCAVRLAATLISEASLMSLFIESIVLIAASVVQCSRTILKLGNPRVTSQVQAKTSPLRSTRGYPRWQQRVSHHVNSRLGLPPP